MTAVSAGRIPAFLNPEAGSAAQIRSALVGAGHFELRELPPEAIRQAVEQEARSGTSRVLVAGGDGTLNGAAAALAGTSTELAVVPAGTLNHFARDLGIPGDPDDAVALARSGVARSVDIARVNDRVFLNTSSVGAYVGFVRTRERWEPRLGYRLASVAAAFRTLGLMRHFLVELEVDGVRRRYSTSLVFVGVDERELRIPMLGGRVRDGRRGLHVLVPRAGSPLGFAALAFLAAMRGIRPLSLSPRLDSVIVHECRIRMRRPYGNVAVDGEIIAMRAPLTYTLLPDALRVVAPPAE